MSGFFRAVASETLKQQRGPALKLALLLPLAFVLLDALFLKRVLLGLPSGADPAPLLKAQGAGPTLGLFWAGFFQPLLLALLPALLVRPDHRARAWKHLNAQPVRPWVAYGARLLFLLALSALSLGWLALLLRAEWLALGWLQPRWQVAFPWAQVLGVLGWSWLGSLPLLTLYLWFSQRVAALAVPVVFGLVGVILTIALSGQELDPLWKRDLIPWLLPYACAQKPLTPPGAKQTTHVAGQTYRFAEQEIKQPKGGRTFKIVIVVPDPPPPTPAWLLATFALGLGGLLAGLGMVDAHFRRS